MLGRDGGAANDDDVCARLGHQGGQHGSGLRAHRDGDRDALVLELLDALGNQISINRRSRIDLLQSKCHVGI